MEVRRNQNDELYHHGVKGQKWGVRRYQNPDGSLTPEGQKHYGNNKNAMKKYYYGEGSKVLHKKAHDKMVKPLEKVTRDIYESKENKEYLEEVEKHVIKRYLNPQTGNIIKIYDGKSPTKIEKQKRDALVKRGEQMIDEVMPSVTDTALDAWGIEKTENARKIVNEILREDITRVMFRGY